MQRLLKIINKTLSVRLSLMVVSAMAVLLMASLVVMLHYSRKTVKEEALHKAAQTLEGTVQRIDNILLSVEQTTGNFFFALMPHISDKDMVQTYCRKLVETNPYVEGCAIAMKPGYYKEGENFMAYWRHEGDSREIVRKKHFGNGPYTEQVWYTRPMGNMKPGWLNPLKGLNAEEKPIFTFSLPIAGTDGSPIGVIGVDVSLELLSNIVAEAKPSANSYCTLLDKDGSFIVHPDGKRLMNKTALNIHDDNRSMSARKAAEAMVSGQTGYMPFTLDGTDYLVFYKPFVRGAVTGRSMEKMEWSAGIIYPEADIFGDYNSLLWYVLAIAFTGLLLLFLMCTAIIHRQLKPLNMLTESAQKIAKGDFKEPIPISRHNDEVGRLQNNFRQMQETLASNIGELEALTATLKERGEGLRKALSNAQMGDRMKTSFLHNMTNQMVVPAEVINNDVEELCEGKESMSLSSNILQNGETIAELLDNLLNVSNEETRKEGTND